MQAGCPGRLELTNSQSNPTSLSALGPVEDIPEKRERVADGEKLKEMDKERVRKTASSLSRAIETQKLSLILHPSPL